MGIRRNAPPPHDRTWGGKSERWTLKLREKAFPGAGKAYVFLK